MSFPKKAKVVIVGGGIHGLSTAWKLSETYKNPGDIIVLDKEDTAAAVSSLSKTMISPGFLYVSESFHAVLSP